jgi:hypothetical protein
MDLVHVDNWLSWEKNGLALHLFMTKEPLKEISIVEGSLY